MSHKKSEVKIDFFIRFDNRVIPVSKSDKIFGTSLVFYPLI